VSDGKVERGQLELLVVGLDAALRGNPTKTIIDAKFDPVNRTSVQGA
jgi:hypothetical protein